MHRSVKLVVTSFLAILLVTGCSPKIHHYTVSTAELEQFSATSEQQRPMVINVDCPSHNEPCEGVEISRLRSHELRLLRYYHEDIVLHPFRYHFDGQRITTLDGDHVIDRSQIHSIEFVHRESTGAMRTVGLTGAIIATPFVALFVLFAVADPML